MRAEPGPRYLAVNGDEGEPGTFKDRYYLERTPHLFLEGMLIAAWAVEADTCFIYMRDEYPAVLEILRREIAALEEAGIVTPGFIDLRRGAGAYICGEESAMIESIEGKRGMPRHRPPYVAQVGIFDRPTLVHNVETLYWVARICREGPRSAERHREERPQGPALLFGLGPGTEPRASTCCRQARRSPTSSRRRGAWLRAMSSRPTSRAGRPRGCCLPAMADIPLDFDTLQPHGSFIGSAAIVILSDQDRARDAALNMLRFFEDESCGQCTPCRVGCEKAVKLMQAETWDRPLLEELCQVMVDASICGLGQAAPNPIRLTMKHFADEV